MVAEATQKTQKRLTGPKKGTANYSIPIFQRLKARNLYLSQGLPHKLIAEATGLKITQVQQLAFREGWTAQRREQNQRLLREADTRTQAVENEVLESVVGLAGQHALQGLSRTGEALERTDRDAARDFQSYTSGVKNLVSIMRDIRAPQAETPEGARLNVFVLRVGDQAKPAQAASKATCEPINVTATAADNGAVNTLSLNNANTQS